MKLLFALLFCPFSLMAQTIGGALPQTNYKNVIQIINNTAPSLTLPNPSGGTYGKFVQAYYVFSGPCILAGGINTLTVTSGGTGYVTGDHVTINGGSTLATFNVTAASGVVSFGSDSDLPPFRHSIWWRVLSCNWRSDYRCYWSRNGINRPHHSCQNSNRRTELCCRSRSGQECRLCCCGGGERYFHVLRSCCHRD